MFAKAWPLLAVTALASLSLLHPTVRGSLDRPAQSVATATARPAPRANLEPVKDQPPAGQLIPIFGLIGTWPDGGAIWSEGGVGLNQFGVPQVTPSHWAKWTGAPGAHPPGWEVIPMPRFPGDPNPPLFANGTIVRPIRR